MEWDRVNRLKQIMAAKGIGGLVLAPSFNFLYAAGYMPLADERPFFMVLGKEDPVFVVPKLQAPELESHVPEANTLKWADGEEPYALYAEALEMTRLSASSIAVDPYLRAGMLLPMMERTPGCRYVPGDGILGEARIIKAPQELDVLRKASSLTDDVMSELPGFISKGMREIDVAATIQQAFSTRGMRRVSFDPIVASGPNSAFPHHSSGERTLRAGDALVLDFGGYLGHYPSDMTRTFFVGEPTDLQREVYQVVLEANEEAFRTAGPGVPAEDVDRAARGVIEKAGYGRFFLHRTGHGVGLEVHEFPNIVEGNATPLREGMVFSIEPGIYLPGEFGVRIEDLVEIGPEGAARLNNCTKQLIVV